MNEEEWEDWIQRHDCKLIEGQESNWFNYFLMLDVRTEYYFRYEGTQTIPPCYGPRKQGSRGNTTHWRVMKDPIRVHPRQIGEMARLIKDRIATIDDHEEFRCKPDTAANVTSDGHVSVSRPLQNYSRPHVMTFCECKNWPSKWPDDRKWCKIQNEQERLDSHAYNFQTNGL